MVAREEGREEFDLGVAPVRAGNAGRPPAFLDPPFSLPLARWWSSGRVIESPEKPTPPFRAWFPEEERGFAPPPYAPFSLFFLVKLTTFN